MNASQRNFTNEHGNKIQIVAAVEGADALISIRGPISRAINRITRMELEQLHAVISEVLGKS